MNKNVWKVGSRWGNMGESVLDLFFDYGCVFFGNAHGGNRGDWNAVERGDLFIVSDGSVPVAIGEALGKFTAWDASGIPFRKRDADEFLVDADAVVCRARLVLLDERERVGYWGIEKTRRAFCRATLAAAKVRSIRNQRARKPEAYAASEYRSIRALGANVASWTKDNAIARRTAIADDFGNWLASPSESPMSDREW